MRYRVFDKTTKEDITDKYTWVITPDGELYFKDYGDLIGDPNATYGIYDMEYSNDIFYKIGHAVFTALYGPLYGKFVDQNGAYEFKNGSLIKGINNNPEDTFRGKRAKIIMQDDDNIPQELIDEVCTPFSDYEVKQ